MILAAGNDYPLLDLFWTMMIFFFWVLWFWLIVMVFSDLFRSPASGWAKVGWAVLVLVLPYVGVLLYLIVNGRTMAERRSAQYERAAADRPARSVSPGVNATEEISRGKQLLDEGTINQQEFEIIKQRSLATTSR